MSLCNSCIFSPEYSLTIWGWKATWKLEINEKTALETWLAIPTAAFTITPKKTFIKTFIPCFTLTSTLLEINVQLAKEKRLEKRVLSQRNLYSVVGIFLLQYTWYAILAIREIKTNNIAYRISESKANFPNKKTISNFSIISRMLKYAKKFIFSYEIMMAWYGARNKLRQKEKIANW